MPRADRLFRLITALRLTPQPATAARLAAETGVSERTLYRDIAALRASGALIDGAPGVGYTLTEDPALPPQMFSRIEVEALALGLSWVRQAGDPDLATAAAGAMAKIVASLPGRVQLQAQHAVSRSIRPGATSFAAPLAAVIRSATWAEQAVDILYRDLDDRETRRRIWPLAMVYFDRTLICLAFCCLRQDFRRFHLDRIGEAAPADDYFRPRRAALLRDYVARLSGS